MVAPPEIDVSHNPHLQKPTQRFGATGESVRVAIIALHGRTHDPSVIRRDVVDHLRIPGVTYEVPAAASRVWYPTSFLAPFEDNEPDLSYAIDCIDTLSNAWVERGVERSAQVILGFSQGACLACEYVYRRAGAARFGALIAFTGGLLGPPGTTWEVDPGAFSGMPVVLGGSTEDPWVPYDRMQETARVFGAGGASVESYYRTGDDHRVYAPQLRLARDALAQLPVFAERHRERIAL